MCQIATTIATTLGLVLGREEGSVLAFMSMPFAAAPVGNRRFVEASPPAPWTHVREAARAEVAF